MDLGKDTNLNIDDEQTSNIQFILDVNGQLTTMPRSEAVPVANPVKYKLKNAFEVFVESEVAEHYWISNYGRCINDIRHKDKSKFFEHRTKTGHITPVKNFYEIVRVQRNGKEKEVMPANYRDPKKRQAILDEVRAKNPDKHYEIRANREQDDTTIEQMVAESFLKVPCDANRMSFNIWHRDGNPHNNWYKNLVYVNYRDYQKLCDGATLDELGIQQEYIEYENKATYIAYTVFNGIKNRCKGIDNADNIGRCYDQAKICQEWLDNPRAFVKWYLEHYYEVDGESMAVDKDLFGNGSMEYSPENCCILPQGLNSMLSNCKKHYYDGDDNTLPLGVMERLGKYYGKIMFFGTDSSILLSGWDTPEEAFAEYKLFKQADILRVAAEYKENIPDYIYRKLLTVEVKPY